MKLKESWLLPIAKTLMTTAIAIVSACWTAGWTAGRVLLDHEKRIGTLEVQQADTAKNTAEILAEIRQDVRELRVAVIGANETRAKR